MDTDFEGKGELSLEWQLRKQMVEYGRRIADRGLVAASDGNLSIRLLRGRFLITPSGLSLGEIRPQDMVLIDANGRQLAGDCKRSSEYRLHLMVYEERGDVMAVVHAHPPIANAFTFAGVSLADCVVPEVVATLGRIPTTDYGTPSSDEGPQVARRLIREHDAIMLQRHGSVTVGKTLREAYHKLEKIEHTAQMLLAARSLGRVQSLSDDEIRKVALLREQLGIGPAADVLRACGLDCGES